MSRVLLIGGTGTVGREVLPQLLARLQQVRVMTRKPAQSGLQPQVEVVGGDLTVPESLDAALKGIDTVFLVWVAPRSAVDPALERITKSARRIVFLSAPVKTPHPLFQTNNLLRDLALHVEGVIEASGVEWTFLRPGMFASNALLWWAGQIRAGNTVRWPYLNVPTAPIDPRDVAAVAVRALCDGGHGGAEYVLTGPESLTHYAQIATIGKVIGRKLRIEDITPDEARRELLSLMPASAITMLMNAWEAASGHPALLTPTVQEVTAVAPRSFAQWALDHSSEFAEHKL